MDETLRQNLCHALEELSTQIVEQSTSAISEEHAEVKYDPLSHLQVLLKQQNEGAGVVGDQEKSVCKTLQMVGNLTKIIADQESCILKLQQERTGAERMAAEISVDLRTQYVEINNLKKRYDSAEEQLSSVKNTVTILENELLLKNKVLADRDSRIRELQQRLTEYEEQPIDSPGVVASNKREDRDKRLAEIRSILSRSNNEPAAHSPLRAKPSSRLDALRAARDSRLQEIRGLLQANGKSNSITQKPGPSTGQQQQYGNIVHKHSVSSTSEESMSDISSLASSVSEVEERHRLYDELLRQRQNLRQMA